MKYTNHSKKIRIMDTNHNVLRVSFLLLLCISFTSLIAQKYFKIENLIEQQSNYALQDVGTGEPFHDGLAVIIKNGLWGAINTSGNIAIQPKYKSLSKFTSGTAIAKTDTGEGIINRNGTFILEPKYEIMRDNSHPGVYEINDKANERHGLFYNGRFVIPLMNIRYLDAHDFPFVSYTLPNNDM